MRVVITPRAEEDLARIWLWIGETHPLNAERFVGRLRDSCESLMRFPFKGRRRDDLIRGTRAIAHGPFLLIYRVRRGAVEVLRVIDGRQNLDALNLDA